MEIFWLSAKEQKIICSKPFYIPKAPKICIVFIVLENVNKVTRWLYSWAKKAVNQKVSSNIWPTYLRESNIFVSKKSNIFVEARLLQCEAVTLPMSSKCVGNAWRGSWRWKWAWKLETTFENWRQHLNLICQPFANADFTQIWKAPLYTIIKSHLKYFHLIHKSRPIIILNCFPFITICISIFI